MHIVIFSEHFHKDPSGPRTSVLSLSDELRAEGHEVTILNIARRKLDQLLDNGSVLRQHPYRLNPVPVRFGKPMYFDWQLRSIHRRRPIDCVLAMGLQAAAAAHRFRRHSGVPYMLNPVSGLRQVPGTWKHDRARKLTLECDAFIGLSRSAVQDWLRDTGVPDSGRCHAVHNGIDPAILDGEVQPIPGVPEMRPLILCMGMLRIVKGQVQLLDALKRVEDLPWHALFAGDGKNAQEIRAHCRAVGLEERTTWSGLITGGRWRWAYRNADLFCLTPIYPEAFGNVFLEAQLAGLPVITSDSGAMPEFVLHGKTGFIVPHEALVERTAEALRKLLTDESLRKQMSLAAQEQAKSFTWKSKALKCVDVIAGLKQYAQ